MSCQQPEEPSRAQCSAQRSSGDKALVWAARADPKESLPSCLQPLESLSIGGRWGARPAEQSSNLLSSEGEDPAVRSIASKPLHIWSGVLLQTMCVCLKSLDAPAPDWTPWMMMTIRWARMMLMTK